MPPGHDEVSGDSVKFGGTIQPVPSHSKPSPLLVHTALVFIAVLLGANYVVGTVSGDDTIFIATPDGRAQQRLLARLREHFGI